MSAATTFVKTTQLVRIPLVCNFVVVVVLFSFDILFFILFDFRQCFSDPNTVSRCYSR